MRVVQLTAENFKRLKAVQIVPDGDTVIISGRNAQGKTSVLDSIWAALGGGPAGRAIPRPVRDGEDNASIDLDLGDLVVSRVWAKSGVSTLTVRGADGIRFPSPQKMLDELVGRLSFDPLAFAEMDDKTQRDTLVGMVELPFDPTDMARRRAGMFEDRTIVGREVKQLAGQLAGIKKPPPDLPTEPVSITALMNQLDEAEAALAVREANERHLAQIDKDIRALEDQLKAARNMRPSIADLVDSPPPAPDVAPIRAALATADETNARIRAAEEYHTVAGALASKEIEVTQLTAEIDKIDKIKADGLQAAKMPLDGLGFDDDGVTYLGVPFRQASGAERLKVSLAIAMAANPKLRVILIRDGSLLDTDSMAMVQQIVTDNDYQLWLEVVGAADGMGVVIEDGAVVST